MLTIELFFLLFNIWFHFLQKGRTNSLKFFNKIPVNLISMMTYKFFQPLWIHSGFTFWFTLDKVWNHIDSTLEKGHKTTLETLWAQYVFPLTLNPECFQSELKVARVKL